MSGTLTMILPLIILLAIMYFLLIRPQKKREKEINAMRKGVQVGDEIITIGGICGKIVKTKEESLVIQVGADKVKFEIMRWAVSRVVEESRKPASKVRSEEPDEVEEAEEEKKPVKKPRRIKKATPVEETEEKAETAETEEVEAEEAEEVKAPETDEAADNADDADEAEAPETEEEKAEEEKKEDK